jgi:hypothetical protein
MKKEKISICLLCQRHHLTFNKNMQGESQQTMNFLKRKF